MGWSCCIIPSGDLNSSLTSSHITNLSSLNESLLVMSSSAMKAFYDATIESSISDLLKSMRSAYGPDRAVIFNSGWTHTDALNAYEDMVINGSKGVYSVHSCVDDALVIYSLIKEGKVVLTLGSCREHLQMILISVSIMMRDESKADALMFAHSLSMQLIHVFSPRPRCGRSLKPSLSYDRMVNGVGVVSHASDVLKTCWRPMVLRKVVLSHVPRATIAGCSPYLMIMQGDQSDIIYSTMVQGLHSFRYEENEELVFDINAVVHRDIVVKLYHLERGQSGAVIVSFRVNVTSAEPDEDNDLAKSIEAGEQLVCVTIPVQAMESVALPNILAHDFTVSCLFGMQPAARSLGIHGPLPIGDRVGPLVLPVSPIVPPLVICNIHPPVQIMCNHCTTVQYAKDTFCIQCRKPFLVVKFLKNLGKQLQTAASDLETDFVKQVEIQSEIESDLDHRDEISVDFQSDLFHPLQVEENLLSTEDVIVVSFPTDDFDIEAILQERLDQVCDILAHQMVSRQRVESHLRVALSGCYTYYEVDDTIMSFIADSMDNPNRLRSVSPRQILIERLPVRVFTRRRSSLGEHICRICLGEYEEHERLRTLPCFHSYHATCIDRWLQSTSKCPVCQQDILVEE